MEPHYSNEAVTLYHGDCREVLAQLPDESVDSVVTDPPYELGFMGKRWDASGIAYDPDLWAECLRALKPGGHLLAFGGTRTWHRLAVAIEDAGFEIRDSIAWMYGSGFPKSLDVSKAIDKAAGAEREVLGRHLAPARSLGNGVTMDGGAAQYDLQVTAPATPDAARWQGWGTALKPAHEPIVVARKPLIGTVAANVLEHGTGGLNIDGCRIGTQEKLQGSTVGNDIRGGGFGSGHKAASDLPAYSQAPGGRWPANVVLDEDQAAALDQQSGWSKSPPVGSVCKSGTGQQPLKASQATRPNGHGDSGGASRFFYVAKASARERPKVDGVAHPTVKPLTLMRWLCRLVTPPGGVILEPFAGSGTTVQAAVAEGFRCIAIEREDDYLPLILSRLTPDDQEPDDGQLTLDASA